ncbi:hypothetical protein [Streptomyces carpinensis]|uniref:Uncharacterized protein n=1 Tax=Streptomyces carpinensis TaxID=66369 RepID=A0ABV1WFQ7_9ACTN|nr:hypothetical protein [Streptomyces carpinensis]
MTRKESTLCEHRDAYRTATGAELPGDSFTIDYPALDPAWNSGFDDHDGIAARLPRIAALCR